MTAPLKHTNWIRQQAAPTLSQRQRLTRVGVVGVTAVAAWSLPQALLALDGPPVCVFRHVTGLPCPLCGGTHALSHLVNLDVAQAVEANVGVTIVAAGAGLWALAGLWEAFRGRAVLRGEPLVRLERSAPALTALVLLSAWVPRVLAAV